ncbi:MAG: AAA family ATPase [Chloroflexi bacterium]|nr:AAA family ATPase [Chloroflexota bacterium]
MVGLAEHLQPGRPLSRLLAGQPVPSVVLHGPPGSGKTTIAMLIASHAAGRFVELSAVSSGIKDVREAIADAVAALQMNDRRTVLFIDEIHRFSRTQQDALLPAVEAGQITLVAATTENPAFSIVSPLLSRSVVVQLAGHTPEQLRALLQRAVTSAAGFGGTVAIADDAADALITGSDGDARRMLTAFEAAAGMAQSASRAEVTAEDVRAVLGRALPRYDRAGDRHYDVAHLLIASMRAGDEQQAMHWLALMLRGGEDPRFIARRLVIFASEDVGFADPAVLGIANAAADATERIGMPECAYALGQAVLACARAPKSRAVTDALGEAFTRVDSGVTDWPAQPQA